MVKKSSTIRTIRTISPHQPHLMWAGCAIPLKVRNRYGGNSMDRYTAKEEIKNKEPNFLEPARKKVNGHATYICPSCGNGSGSSGDGIVLDPTSKGNYYKCFRCGLHEDTIGLWKLYTRITDDKQAFTELYRYYGLQVDDYTTQTKTELTSDIQKEVIDNTAYYQACMEKVSQTDYFKRRGLSESVIAKYRLGYDSNYNKGTGGKVWKAVIIPTGNTSYVARNTALDAEKGDRYRKAGASQLYLKENLAKASSPIFIVEGELDALSIIEVGGEAVALGSTANYRQLIQAVQKQKPVQPLILALDNDEGGEKTEQILADELTALDIPFYRYSIYGNSKDANEALLVSRDELTKSVKKVVEETKSTEEEKRLAQKEAYLKTSVVDSLRDFNFIDGIALGADTPLIPTGFKALDSVLDGGLYEGLYLVGAISSLGKTTLVLQIADQIAESGEDVLIFSLEMAKTELMAKSISRLTLLDVLQNNGSMLNAKTTRGITTRSRYTHYSQVELDLIKRAVTAYGKYAGHIYIHEGIGSIGVQQIRDIISQHIYFTGKKPVVFIDYVQILAPADIRATDKQNTDKAVLELKRISRDYKLPIIGVSSVNRASYNAQAAMEMLKESGALEFGSDVIWGLQLKGVGQKNFDVNVAKNKNPRDVELVVLKNRNGATGDKLSFEYYPMFNYFKEVGTC